MSSSTPSSTSSPPSSLRPLSISTSSSPTDDIPPAIRSPLTPLPHLDSASHAAFVTEDRLEAYRLINIATREQLRTLVDMLSLDEMRSLLHRTVRGVSARRVKEWKQRLVECRAGEGVSRPELCLLGLPRELCCNIFQYLDVYTMWFGANFVSRAWRKTVQSPDSWRVVTFPSETWGKLLKSIIDNKHRKSAHSPYSYMQRWMPAWTRVHHLQFMPEPVCVKGSHTEPLYAKESTLALLEHYMASLAHLRILDLNASRMRYVKDMHLGYIAAGASCRKLEELHVNCSAVTDEGLKLLASGCTGLRRLELASLSRITDHGIKYIIKNCTKLEHLQLKSAREITNESVQTLVQSCPKLTQLTITSMGRLTHVGIEALQSLPELQHLDLSGCRAAFTPSRGLDLVTRKCKSLEHLCLDMIDIPATAFQHIATDLPKLNTLICSTAVTDESLISLSTGVCSASLESLVCKGITAQITDRGILALVSGCPILHTLHLGAPGITNLSLLALSLYCPNLKMLSFSSPLISDQGLKYLCTCTRPLLPVDVVRPAPAPKEKRLSTSRNPTTQPAPVAPQPPPTLARFDHQTNTTYYTSLIDPIRDNSPAARAARRQQQLAQIFTRFPSIAFLPAHFSQSFEEVRWIHQQPSVDVDIRVHPVTGRCTLLIEPSSLAYPNQYSGSTLPPEMKETSPVIPTPVTAPGTLPMPHTHLHPHGVPPPSAYPPGYTGAALANMNMTQAAAAVAQLPPSYIPSFAAVPQHADTAYGHSPDPEYDQDESFQFEIDGSAAEEKMAFPIPPPPQASTAAPTLPPPPPASLSQPGATSTSSAMSSSRLSVSAALVAATATSASGARAPIQHSVSSVSSTNQAPMSGFPARLGSGPVPTTSTGVAVHGLGLAAALSTGPPVGLTRHGAPLSNVPATATATANTNLAIANISDAANAEAKSIPTSTSPSSITPASTPVPPPARRSRSRARVTDETASGNNTSRRASSPSSGARPSLVSSYSSSSSSQHILSLDDEDHLEPMDGTSQETDNNTASNTTSTSISTAIPHHNKSSTRHTPSTSMSASYTMDDDDETQFGTSQPDATFFPPPTGPSNDFPSSTPASTSSLAFSIPQSGSTSLPTPFPTTATASAPTSSRRTERKDDVADLSRRMAGTRLDGQPTSSRRAAAAAAAAAAGSGTAPAHSRATSAAVPVPGVSRAHRSAEHGTSHHNSRRRPSSSSRDRRSTGDERKHSSSVSGAMDDEAMEVENDDVSVDGDHPRDDGELEIELDEDGNGEHPSGDVEGEFSGEEEETEHDGDEWLHGLVHLQSMATKLDYIFSMHQKRKAAIQATQGPCSGITCLGFGSNGGIDEDLEYELKQQIDSITGQGLGCPKLEALAVQHCLGIRDISVLVTGCPRLNTLLLNGCVNISGDQLRLLAQAPSLKSVRCSGRGSSERAAIDYLKFLGFEVKHSSSNRF